MKPALAHRALTAGWRLGALAAAPAAAQAPAPLPPPSAGHGPATKGEFIDGRTKHPALCAIATHTEAECAPFASLLPCHLTHLVRVGCTRVCIFGASQLPLHRRFGGLAACSLEQPMQRCGVKKRQGRHGWHRMRSREQHWSCNDARVLTARPLTRSHLQCRLQVQLSCCLLLPHGFVQLQQQLGVL